MSGWKTYTGGIGLILLGIGGLLTGQVSVNTGGMEVASGLITIGFRHFGQILMDLLKK